MFYQEATAKARLRISSVRIKPGVSHETGKAIMAMTHEYQHCMRAEADIDPLDDRRLEFWHADNSRVSLALPMQLLHALMERQGCRLH